MWLEITGLFWGMYKLDVAVRWNAESSKNDTAKVIQTCQVYKVLWQFI